MQRRQRRKGTISNTVVGNEDNCRTKLKNIYPFSCTASKVSRSATKEQVCQFFPSNFCKPVSKQRKFLPPVVMNLKVPPILRIASFETIG